MLEIIDTEKIINNALDVSRSLLLDRPLESEIILEQLLRASPDHPEGLGLFGVVKQKLQRHEEAIDLFIKAIELVPDNADNYNNIALSYANLNNYEKSIEFLNKSLELRPNYNLYISNLALQYRQTGDYELSKKLLSQALSMGETADIWCNLGGVYGEERDLDRSEECFLKAIELDNNCAAAHVDLAFCRHLKKDWAGGFKEYEWRFDYFPQLKYYNKTYDQSKKWLDQDLTGKTILLYGEQGLGDQIQFVRYCRFLKNAKVIVHCPAILAGLLRNAEGVSEVTTEVISYDYQCSLMSLPYLLGNFDICGEPYFKATSILNYADYKNCFKVGVCWAGSPAHPNDACRSTYLRNFRGIHDLPGVKLFNLQTNLTKRVYAAGKKIVDYAEGCEGIKLVDMTPMMKTFEEAAGVINGLDIIITVDTALAHLAGAMGVRCWLLLPFNPDWRWGIDGNTTEWYSSLRLFRQKTRNDWAEVFSEVEKECGYFTE